MTAFPGEKPRHAHSLSGNGAVGERFCTEFRTTETLIAIPGNIPSLESFRTQVVRYWLRALRRRCQKHRLSWEVFGPLVDRLILRQQVLHAHPNLRFYAKHPR